jgi:hypothetical protein
MVKVKPKITLVDDDSKVSPQFIGWSHALHIVLEAPCCSLFDESGILVRAV